jgi:undecaprenyl-diphosphatase
VFDTLLTLDTNLVVGIASGQNPWLDPVMLALTSVGRRGLLWLVLGVLVAWRWPARLGGLWQLALAICLTWVVVDLIVKPAVGRQRPYTTAALVSVVGDRPTSPSFPSGHAATAFAGALAVGRMWKRGRGALWGLAALIAFSRVYLGVHYVSDVAAGALIGTIVAYMATGATEWDAPAT